MVEKEEEERWVQIVRQKLLVLLLVLVLPKLVVLLIVSLFFCGFLPVAWKGDLSDSSKVSPKK